MGPSSRSLKKSPKHSRHEERRERFDAWIVDSPTRPRSNRKHRQPDVVGITLEEGQHGNHGTSSHRRSKSEAGLSCGKALGISGRTDRVSVASRGPMTLVA